jgi:hypothetical protein
MVPEWLHILALVSLSVAFLSAGVIVIDVVVNGHTQKMGIMNFVWPITALYFGPLALWAYWRLGRAESQKAHADSSTQEQPFWRSVFVGSTHCGAGCALGDIIGEWTVFATGLVIAGSRLFTDYVVDFALAYTLGIVFQYFAIAPMRHLSLGKGILEAIKADTVSLVAFEVGMFLWMALAAKLMFHPPLHPDNAVYWFMMQIGMVVGFITTFPANWLLIRRGVKTAM